MNSISDQTQIIEGLAKNEEIVSELYKIYADKFPQHTQFWLGLNLDEISHANWLRGLFQKIEKGSVYFNEDRFSVVAIKSFSNYVENRIKEANNETMESIKADSISLDIEKAWIEKKFFEVIETDSSELKIILSSLKRATKKHIKMVEDVWLEEKDIKP